MCKLKESHPDNLPDREQRAMAKMARIARCDCWHGGARAMVLAERLSAMGSRINYDSVVSEAYASNTGRAASYLAFECPECGCAHMGEDAAFACCAFDESDSEEFADD